MNEVQSRQIEVLEKRSYYFLREYYDRVVMVRKRRPVYGSRNRTKSDYKGVLVNGTVVNMAKPSPERSGSIANHSLR